MGGGVDGFLGVVCGRWGGGGGVWGDWGGGVVEYNFKSYTGSFHP
jgi:hypothetical protein